MAMLHLDGGLRPSPGLLRFDHATQILEKRECSHFDWTGRLRHRLFRIAKIGTVRDLQASNAVMAEMSGKSSGGASRLV